MTRKMNILRSRVRRFESCRGRSQLSRPDQGLCPGQRPRREGPVIGPVGPCWALFGPASGRIVGRIHGGEADDRSSRTPANRSRAARQLDSRP